jgi:2-succinyl-6-hydroxy-2,4-cyclohexadiene-1-carboxylate synthase
VGRARRRVPSATVRSRRVVLVHGFTQTGASWRRVATLLEPLCEVVALDLPGHGSSSERSVTGMSEAAALIGEAGRRATYVGYSLGGRLCLTLALEHPELVEQLVLVGATAGIEDPDERAARRVADGQLADKLDPVGGTEPMAVSEFLGEWLKGPLFGHLDAEQADVASRKVNTGAGLAASLRSVGTGSQQPSWDRLSGLEMPVLLVTGERDEKFGRLAEAMVARIGDNASHVVVPGAGHAVPFEAPEAFAALVAEALTGRSRG